MNPLFPALKIRQIVTEKVIRRDKRHSIKEDMTLLSFFLSPKNDTEEKTVLKQTKQQHLESIQRFSNPVYSLRLWSCSSLESWSTLIITQKHWGGEGNIRHCCCCCWSVPRCDCLRSRLIKASIVAADEGKQAVKFKNTPHSWKI